MRCFRRSCVALCLNLTLSREYWPQCSISELPSIDVSLGLTRVFPSGDTIPPGSVWSCSWRQCTTFPLETICVYSRHRTYLAACTEHASGFVIRPVDSLKVEAPRIVRRRGSHIFKRLNSQMAVRLSTLCASRALLPGSFLALISVKGWVDARAMLRLEGLSQLKNAMTWKSNPWPGCW
jgi:hypothetical protein